MSDRPSILRPLARVVLRLLLAPLVVMAFAAPSPGDIKSCTDNNAGPEASEHCTNKKTLQCQRMNFRDFSGMTNTEAARAALSACVSTLPEQCSGAQWPVGCEPTQTQVQGCYDALLVNPDQAAGDEPPECQLCAEGGI